MPFAEDTRVFPLPQREIYALLMDVENFPSYVPYIRAARFVSRKGAVSVAEIDVGVTGLHFRYRCEMLFEALDESHTRVTYRFSSRFRSRLMNAVADPVFSVQLKSTLRELEKFIRRRKRR